MKDEPDIAPIAGICERDIDLLLYEEFVASLPFLEWFVGRVDAAASVPLSLVAVHRARTDSTGESDLEVAYADSNGTVARVLIENKVAAAFRPRQAERYHERGASYLTRGESERVTTVLVAPSSYFSSSGDTYGFGHVLTYEELRDWFAADSSMGPRRVSPSSPVPDDPPLGLELEEREGATVRPGRGIRRRRRARRRSPSEIRPPSR